MFEHSKRKTPNLVLVARTPTIPQIHGITFLSVESDVSPDLPFQPIEPQAPVDATTVDLSRTGDCTPLALPHASAQPDWPMIAGYQIASEIARGGMGRVYAGHDLTLDREVAVKTLLPGADPNRFVIESKITARLPHPGIPPVHALGTLGDGSPYLVMKLVRGRTLHDLLKERPSVQDGLSQWVQVFEQIAQAVGFAHAQGIIHRDLKPANVMVGAFGEVQVMDWGLAKDLQSREPEGPVESADAPGRDVTRAGTIMGTPGYMAPEQARGEILDARADVFALGGILTVILTGKKPIGGGSVDEIIAKTALGEITETLRLLDACGADVELIALAKRCLAVQAEDRLVDARVVAEQVATYRASVEARLRHAETEREKALVREAEGNKRRRVLQVSAGVVAVVLIAGIVGTSIGMISASNEATEKETARQNEANAKIAAVTAAIAEKDAAEKARDAAEKARQEKKKAEQEKAIAFAVRDFLQTRMIRQANPFEHSRWAYARTDKPFETGQTNKSSDAKELTVRALLERAAQEFSPEMIAQKFPDQPLVQAEILESIGETYEGLKEYAKAVRFVEAAQALRDKHLGTMHPASLRGQTNLVFVNLAAARPLDAVKAMNVLGDRLDLILHEVPDGSPDSSHPAVLKLDAVLNRIEERSNPTSFAYPRFEPTFADSIILSLQVPTLIERVARMSDTIANRFGVDNRRTLVVEMWRAFAHHAVQDTKKASAMYENILARGEKNLTADDRVLDGLREVLVITYVELNIKQSEMMDILEKAYESRRKQVGPVHPGTLNSLHKLAFEYQNVGRTKDAIALLESGRDACLKSLGVENTQTLEIELHLAQSYRIANRTPEAVALLKHVRDIRTKNLGADHSETLDVIYGLAQTYQNARQYSEAIKYYEQVRDIEARNQLGPENPDSAETFLDLAKCYSNIGKRADALAIYDQIRAIHEKRVAQHADSIAVLDQLAGGYLNLNKSTEAIALYERVHTAKQKAHGADGRDTLITMINLATAYQADGQVKRAVPIFEKTVAKMKAKLGPDHAVTVGSTYRLGLAYEADGQVRKAIPLYEEALAKKKAILGADHPDTLTNMNYLASAYKVDGQIKKALALFKATLEKRMARLGPDHLDTLNTMNNLASAHEADGQVKKAVPLYEETLAKKKVILAPDHPDVLVSMNNLASAYHADGQVKKAVSLHEETLAKRKAILGPDHPDTLTSMNNLAYACRADGRAKKAILMYEETMAKRKAILGRDHLDTLQSMNNLAYAYRVNGQVKKAMPLYEETLTRRKAILGPDHPDTILTMNGLAFAYAAEGQWKKAVLICEETLAIRKAKLGPDDPKTLLSMNKLAFAYRKDGQGIKALLLYEDALAKMRVNLGPDHPETLDCLQDLAAAYEEVRNPDAEKPLRQTLAIRQVQEPDAWTTFHFKSLVGLSLLGQKNYKDAEPLLRAGLDGIQNRAAKIPAQQRDLVFQLAMGGLAELYEATRQKEESNLQGILTDKKSQVVHEVKLNAGQAVVILMESGQFDTLLQVKDANGKVLIENDDIDFAAKKLNSRIWLMPPADGVYRIVATSFQTVGRGDYKITIRQYREGKSKE